MKHLTKLELIELFLKIAPNFPILCCVSEAFENILVTQVLSPIRWK